MIISSRTPEGSPADCPFCGAELSIEPSPILGDAPCPCCGTLLWVVNLPDNVRVVEYAASQADRNRVLAKIASIIGVDEASLRDDPTLIEKAALESVEMVELIMELEELFDE